MLRVQTKVGVFPRHVSGEDVVVFVPGDGVAVDGESELQKKHQEQSGDTNGDPGAASDLNALGQVPSDAANLLRCR